MTPVDVLKNLFSEDTATVLQNTVNLDNVPTLKKLKTTPESLDQIWKHLFFN